MWGLSLVECKARHLKGLAWAGGVTDRPQGKVKGPLELRGVTQVYDPGPWSLTQGGRE